MAPNSSEKQERDDNNFKHKEYLKVVQSDAKRLADRIKENYKETVIDTATTQACEIIDDILDTNSHDSLGQSPEALLQVMQLL